MMPVIPYGAKPPLPYPSGMRVSGICQFDGDARKLPQMMTYITTNRFVNVNKLLIKDDSLAPDASAIDIRSVIDTANTSGYLDSPGTFNGIRSRKYSLILLSTSESTYALRPFTTLADPVYIVRKII